MASFSEIVAGIEVPRTEMSKAAAELAFESETEVLYNHSQRVFLFASLAGRRSGLPYDPELLYVASMLHDIGLTPAYATADESFEVDGANTAREFLQSFDVARGDVDEVWDAIALHATPEIARHKEPLVALLAAGVLMDVMGSGLHQFPSELIEEISLAYPRSPNFKYDIIASLYCGTFRRPRTSFGNLAADVLGYLDHTFVRPDFCKMVLQSEWS